MQNKLSIQEKIDAIIYSDINKKKKFKQLKELFQSEKISYFSDFDDTLSTSECVFYTKVKILIKKGKNILEKQKELVNVFILNKKFPPIKDKIVLITRNNLLFLKILLSEKEEYLRKNKIDIVWVIGQDKDFLFTSKEKLEFLPWDAFFIGDSFEDKKLQSYKNFINVNELNFFDKIFVKIKKIFILIKFLMRWI